jgi:hypothetical protein
MDNQEGNSVINDESRRDASQRDTSRHTVTIKQAARLFAEYGVPRSPRSVQRFCELNHLDSIRVQGNKTERYFIDPLSVKRYAEELKQLDKISQLGSDVTRHDATQRDMSRHDAPTPVVTSVSEPAAETDPEQDQLRDRVDTLEKENVQLRIDLGARVFFINQITSERREFIEMISNQSREIGRLETKVLQLGAPQETVTRHDAPADVAPIAAVIVEQGGRGVTDAEPVRESPTASVQGRPGFFGRMFGSK